MILKKIIPLTLTAIYFCNAMHAQDSAETKNKVIFSGYAEMYYIQDSKAGTNHERANFLYNHKRSKEINLNLAYAKAAYNNKNTRANLALMVGNYAQYNLANEDVLARHIYEANIGVALNKKNTVWLDAGVMPSHIGFESAIAQDCWTPSRSIVAENSPYFNTGVKLSTVSKNQKWNASILMLNGWQQIQKLVGQNQPSFGAQINYKPNERLTCNYSNFYGSTQIDAAGVKRFYNNLYALYESPKKWGVQAGLDIGVDINTAYKKVWYTPVIIGRCAINKKNNIAARLEYLNDRNAVILTNNNGGSLIGASLNFDFKIASNCMWRTEVKRYSDRNKLYLQNNYSATSLLTTLSIQF